MRSIGVFVACAGVLLSLTAAYGLPKRIIILRHAEKIENERLCQIGERRAEALKEQYLGKGAQKSLFADGEQPAAFYAITGHTKDTIKPAAKSWNLEVIRSKAEDDESKDAWKNQWTQDAAKDVLTNKDYNGKIVVMAWEHHRIADATLPEDDTLRHLLGIDSYADSDVRNWSKNWCGSNYDYFWIVDYDPDAKYDPKSGVPPTPTKVARELQDFDSNYNVPKNLWGCDETPTEFDGCSPTRNPTCTNLCPKPQ